MSTMSPPANFDASFFDWLETVGDELLVRFIDRGGMLDSQIDELEREVGEQIPPQVRVYYENCSPWGIHRKPHSVWQRIKDEVRNVPGVKGLLIPIDINSQQGNYTVARLHGSGKYEIVNVRRDGSVRVYKDLRSYFIQSVEEEIKLSS